MNIFVSQFSFSLNKLLNSWWCDVSWGFLHHTIIKHAASCDLDVRCIHISFAALINNNRRLRIGPDRKTSVGESWASAGLQPSLSFSLSFCSDKCSFVFYNTEAVQSAALCWQPVVLEMIPLLNCWPATSSSSTRATRTAPSSKSKTHFIKVRAQESSKAALLLLRGQRLWQMSLWHIAQHTLTTAAEWMEPPEETKQKSNNTSHCQLSLPPSIPPSLHRSTDFSLHILWLSTDILNSQLIWIQPSKSHDLKPAHLYVTEPAVLFWHKSLTCSRSPSSAAAASLPVWALRAVTPQGRSIQILRQQWSSWNLNLINTRLTSCRKTVSSHSLSLSVLVLLPFFCPSRYLITLNCIHPAAKVDYVLIRWLE